MLLVPKPQPTEASKHQSVIGQKIASVMTKAMQDYKEKT